MFGLFEKGADGLVRLSAFVGTLGLITEVVVIITDVVGRYFGAPLKGAQDISQMAMVLIVFGGMAICEKVRGHIVVDLFERQFSPAVIRLGDLFSAILGAAIFLGIAYMLWESAALSRMLNLSTNIINLPKAWFQYAAIVMSLITALVMILRAISLAFGGAPSPHQEEAL